VNDLDKTGVYEILNKANGKCYVGSTANSFYKRWRDHRKNLRRGTHTSTAMQNAYNKYGEDNLEFKIIEICDRTKCIEREQFYFDTLNPEYNICKTAGNTLGQIAEHFMSPEAIKIKRQRQSISISKALMGKKKTDEHAKKCGAKPFNVYKAICKHFRTIGHPSVYEKGEFVGTWLRREDCGKDLGIGYKFIGRCLKHLRSQHRGYIFEYVDKGIN
jgi:group I intron endonuclease